MHTLLVEDQADEDQPILAVLSGLGRASVLHELDSIQKGIEALEREEVEFDLIVCDYHGTSNVLLGAFVSLARGVPCAICVDDDESRVALAAQFGPNLNVQLLLRHELRAVFSRVVEELLAREALRDLETADTDFVAVKIELLRQLSPIRADVYIRLAEDRYCRLFRRGDSFEAGDLERFRDKKKTQALHLRKDAYQAFLEHQDEQLSQLVGQPTTDDGELSRRADLALQCLSSLVDRMGFSPVAQKLAKTSVQATLKLIGSRPKLAPILERLRFDEGRYITAHSMALAQIACALSFRIGWTSASTYFKLTAASLLHDLPIRDNTLARCGALDDARANGYSDAEVRNFKMHPLLAAKYAAEFHDIPPDVDTILLQHHERPDGTGFPRGLLASRISPLASLFIIAHDLVHFALHDGAGYPEQFFALKGPLYSSGHFKKIILALESGTPIDALGKP